MTGDGLGERYWPTTATFAMSIACPDCGELFSCPCAIADNEATGQGDE